MKTSYKREWLVAEGPREQNATVYLGSSEAVVRSALRLDKVASTTATSRRVAGFTLIELMITLVVTVILLVLAIPSFSNLILSNKLTTTANDMVAAINSARIEAVKRNAATQFCANTASANATGTSDVLGMACGTQTGAVYLLPTPASTAALPVLAAVVGLTSPLQMAGGTSVALRFNGQGLAQIVGKNAPFTGNVMDICTTAISSNNHRVIAMVAGSNLVTTTPTTNSPCP